MSCSNAAGLVAPVPAECTREGPSCCVAELFKGAQMQAQVGGRGLDR
jgi:hypothetical protein